MVKKTAGLIILGFFITAYSQDLSNLPPPPPPSPSNSSSQPNVITEEKDLKSMTQKELTNYLKDLDKKDQIIRQQDFLRYGGSKEIFLRDSNTFYYTSSLPILFIYPKNIDSVTMYSGSGKIVYDKNNLIFIPPTNEDGKLVGFIVIFEDKSAKYFVGERITISDKNKDREVTVTYKFIEPIKVSLDRIIESFMVKYKRCPIPGETINVNGYVYRFEDTGRNFLKDENEFYCNTYMKVVEVR